LALTKGPAGRATEVAIPLGLNSLYRKVMPVRKAVGEGPLRLAQCVANLSSSSSSRTRHFGDRGQNLVIDESSVEPAKKPERLPTTALSVG
jgi:hypothetical protein